MNISSTSVKYRLCNDKLMNKIALPALLAATIMVAGAFAFMPVEQASTVHTSSSITIANDAITEAKIADDAIDTEHITAAFTTELQSVQIVATSTSDFSGTITCTATGASFLVHYNISAMADNEVITIGGTATAVDLVFTEDFTDTTTGAAFLSGTVGGTTAETVTFDSSATTANIQATIETATGATGVDCT